MWPTGPLLFQLPCSFQAFEEKHLLEVRCVRCRHIVAMFSAAGAQPEAILESGGQHRCTVNEAISGMRG